MVASSIETHLVSSGCVGILETTFDGAPHDLMERIVTHKGNHGFRNITP